MAMPSRINDGQLICESFLNLPALTTAAVNPLTREPLSRLSTSPVRNTRCGMPSTRVDTTVPSNPDCR